jgi:cob(I)alamin adenosyltransferase
MKGPIHIYTGDGKGKTTAALGRVIQAAGAGHKVFIAQFNKKGDYSEIKALKRFSDLVTVEQYGLGRFIHGKPLPEDINAARKGLKRIASILSAGKHQLVVLDEANVAADIGLFSVQDLMDAISGRPEQTALVITGRGASPPIIAHADIVIEMKEIKHYYQKGVQARVGIEK